MPIDHPSKPLTMKIWEKWQSLNKGDTLETEGDNDYFDMEIWEHMFSNLETTYSWAWVGSEELEVPGGKIDTKGSWFYSSSNLMNEEEKIKDNWEDITKLRD